MIISRLACQRLYLIDVDVVAGCVVRFVVVVVVLGVIVVRGVVLGAAVVVIAAVGWRRCASVVDLVLPPRIGAVTTLLVGGSTKFVTVGLNTFLKSLSKRVVPITRYSSTSWVATNFGA